MYKLLIIENSKSYSNTIKAFFENDNFKVTQAFFLKDALKELSKQKFDFILLDSILPGCEGDDLILQIINNEYYAKTKTIILGTEQDIQTRRYLYEYGIIEYFSKTTPMKNLVSEIISLIKNLKFNKDKNIMIVDESKFLRQSMKDGLETRNYNILTYDNPRHALEYLDKNAANIDLIFYDIEMNEINGIEFLIKAKNNKLLRLTPIIILSNTSDRELYTNALKNGAVDFIRKPFLIEEILLKADLHIKQKFKNKKINYQAQELKEYKRALSTSDIVSKSDKHGKIIYVNNKFCEISGYRKDELLGKNHNIVRHPDVPKKVFKELWETIKAQKTFQGIIKNKKKNGDAYYVDVTITPIVDINGDTIEYLAIRHDITDVMNPKRQLLDDLKYLDNPIIILVQISNYDILKEFYSEEIRNEFEEVFSNSLISFFPEYAKMRKVYILGNGLLGFIQTIPFDLKNIDLCLQEVITKLNENGVVFQGNKYDIDIVTSFSNEGNNLYDDALIGINEALKNKSNIVYASNYYTIKQREARNKLKTLTTIRDVLRVKDRIISYYQPIIDNKTKEIVKYESLIRMINQKNEVLTPNHFLDLAKKTGYYHDITLKVIENASIILEKSKFNININLSASDIEDLGIRTKLLDLITKDENKGRITFELLEDEDAKNFSLIKDFIGL